MQYCAIVNTATPATGLITVGEVLTDRQAAALGEEKLEELVRVGVLRVMRDAPSAPETGTSKESVTEQDSEPTAADDHEEDLPVLEGADELVTDEKPSKRRRRGSTKRKEGQD